MRYILSSLLLFATLLRSTLATFNITQAGPAVTCSSTTVRHVELVHCYYLISDLLASPWYKTEIRYGTRQPLPGRVPRHQDHRTCRMELFATPEAGAATEEMALVDDLRRLDDIVDVCIEPGRGYTGGTAYVGTQRKFKVYMGGFLPPAQT